MRETFRRVSLKDVAAACNLSVNTVSDILNRGKSYLYRPETIQKVREVAKQLNYRPNLAAQAIRLQRLSAVAFVAPNCLSSDLLTNYVVYPFLIGANHYLVRHHYHLVLMELIEFTEGGQTHGVSPLERMLADGFLIHYGIPLAAVQEIEEFKIPAIWWDANRFEPTNCIYRDEYQVGYRLTQELIALKHQRIAFYGIYLNKKEDDPHYHYSTSHRYQGYLAALREANLPPLPFEAATLPDIVDFIQREKPTAIITLGVATFGGAWDILEAVHQLGLRIPQDISIATCDFEKRYATPFFKVGGIAYDRYQLGWEAASMIIELIRSRTLSIPSRKFTGEFTKGDSIGQAPITTRLSKL